MKTTWTVIGIDNNNVVYAKSFITEGDFKNVILAAARDVLDIDDIQILGAVEGEVKIRCASDANNGSASWASDIVGDDLKEEDDEDSAS